MGCDREGGIRPPDAGPARDVNVAFTEWTEDGKLRHPRYEGLRPDKDPRTVTRETP